MFSFFSSNSLSAAPVTAVNTNQYDTDNDTDSAQPDPGLLVTEPNPEPSDGDRNKAAPAPKEKSKYKCKVATLLSWKADRDWLAYQEENYEALFLSIFNLKLYHSNSLIVFRYQKYNLCI